MVFTVACLYSTHFRQLYLDMKLKMEYVALSIQDTIIIEHDV